MVLPPLPNGDLDALADADLAGEVGGDGVGVRVVERAVEDDVGEQARERPGRRFAAGRKSKSDLRGATVDRSAVMMCGRLSCPQVTSVRAGGAMTVGAVKKPKREKEN